MIPDIPHLARQSTAQPNGLRHSLAVILLLLAVFLLAACTPSGQAGGDDYQPLSFSEFPNDLGRGFPLAQSVKSGSSEVGDEAPNFAFVLEDGRGTDLHSLRGVPVVLNFWATWCGPCRAEMPEFVALSQSGEDVIVLEVNVQENREVIEPFAREFGMNMTVIQDPPGAIRTAYGVRNMPTTLFIDRSGTIQARWAGLLVPAQLDAFVSQITE